MLLIIVTDYLQPLVFRVIVLCTRVSVCLCLCVLSSALFLFSAIVAKKRVYKLYA